MLGISKKLSQSIRVGALGVSLIVSASIANAENWPNWRGPADNGHAAALFERALAAVVGKLRQLNRGK